MRFGSVCSGIEAASMAWMPLGWEPAWFSEIEPFPCAVLKHHHPDVPNHGDMTTLPARILAGEVEAPDVLVGGTPCQAFSVAGLRQGLNDPRGRLTRTYVEICDAIDTVRAAAGKPPVILVWENVPGVLSDNGNAFGNFLGALSGEDGALEPPGGKWTNAGLVCGPTRDLAWRVLDAQYFGVAQRRRRVFLVGHSRAGSLRPVKVLLVEQGVQRHSPPSREAGQRAAAVAGAGAQGGSGLGTDFDLDGGLVRHDGGRGIAYGFQPRISRNGRGDMGDLVNALNAQSGESGRGDAAPCVAHVVAPPVVGFQTRGSNIDVGAISGTLGTNADRASGSAPMIAHVVAPPQTDGGRGVAVAHVDVLPTMVSGGSTEGSHNQLSGQLREQYIVPHVVAPPLTATQADVAGPLDSHYYKGPGSRQGGEREYVAHALPVWRAGDQANAETLVNMAGTLNCNKGQQGGVLFAPATHPEVAEVCGTISDEAHNGGGLNGQDAYTGRILPVVQCVTGERTHALKAEGADGSEDGTGRGTSGSPPGVMSAMAIAPAITASNDPSRSPQSSEVTQQVAAVHAASMAVRRLTPVECERLQGFPDEYTRIPWKRKPADDCPDGPRYKALGNSMAVPCMMWIGVQIQKALA